VAGRAVGRDFGALQTLRVAGLAAAIRVEKLARGTEHAADAEGVRGVEHEVGLADETAGLVAAVETVRRAGPAEVVSDERVAGLAAAAGRAVAADVAGVDAGQTRARVPEGAYGTDAAALVGGVDRSVRCARQTDCFAAGVAVGVVSKVAEDALLLHDRSAEPVLARAVRAVDCVRDTVQAADGRRVAHREYPLVEQPSRREASRKLFTRCSGIGETGAA